MPIGQTGRTGRSGPMYSSDEEYYGDDYYDYEAEWRMMGKRKKKSTAKAPKKVKVQRATKEDVELRQLLAAAERQTLERLIYDLAHQKKAPTVASLLTALGGGKSKTQEVQSHDEILADMGLFNSVNRDNLLEVMSFLPDVRDRLTFASEVCKTWRAWLKGQPVLFESINLSFHKYSGATWCDGNGLLRLIASAPDGSIKRLDLSVDEKAPGFNRKSHIEGIFKLGKQFSNLTHLTLRGRKITSETVRVVAETCAGTIQDFGLFGVASDYNRQVDLKLLRSAPYLRNLQIDISTTQDLNSIREAVVAARGGSPPLLESLSDQAGGWDSFQPYGSFKPLGEVLTLVRQCPHLKKLQMRVLMPKTEEEVNTAMRGLTGPFPQIEDITFTLGPQLSATSVITGGLQAFFSRLPNLFPNLRRFSISRTREWHSQKEIKRGATYRPPPVLTAHHFFPHLERLQLSYFEIDASFLIDGPCLKKILLDLPSGVPATPIYQRLKATCPNLEIPEPKKW